MHRELDRDFEHVLAEQRHPGGAVRLLEMTAGRQRRAAIEYADVVEPEEPAFEDVLAVAILAIHPPREVEQQRMKGALQPLDVAAAAARGRLEAVREDRRPRVHRRIDVAEVPFVRRQLTVRMQVVARAA